MQIVFGGLQNMVEMVRVWFGILIRAEVSFSIVFLLALLAAVLILLWSAALSAQISEARGYNPFYHFWGGLLAPFLYPLFLRLVLRPREGSLLYIQRCRSDRDEEQANRKAEAERAKLHAAEEQRIREEADPSVWSAARIQHTVYRADGQFSGPFELELNDGSRILVQEVQQLLPEVAVLGVLSSKGELSVIRIPYKRIQTVHTK